jgi:hypothetical protein
MKWLLFLPVTLVLLHGLSYAQLSVRLDKKKIQPGESVTVRITIHGKNADSVQEPSNLRPLEILSKGEVLVTPTDSGFQSTQQWIITSFDSGTITLPPLSSATGWRSLAETLQVRMLPIDSIPGYADIKAVVPDPVNAQWPYRLGLLAIALLSGYLLWRLAQRTRVSQQRQQLQRLANPQVWEKEMAKLSQQWAQQKITARPAAQQLMLLMRALLHYRGTDTSALTGREAIALAEVLFGQRTLPELQHGVEACYGILFGKWQPANQDFLETIKGVQQAGIRIFHPPKSSPAE